MFWGLVVQPNKKYSKTVSTPFHVSQAVLETTNCEKDVQLILKSDKIDYILCILRKNDLVQVPLDLIFSEGDEISFRSVGGTVHLTGYLVDDQEYPNMGDVDSSEVEEEVPQLVPVKSSKKVKQAVPEQDSSSDNESDGSQDEEGSDDDTDEDDDDDNEDDDEIVDSSDDDEPSPKKTKLPNGTINGVSKKDDTRYEKNIKQKSKLQGNTITPEKTLQGGVKIEDIRLGKGPEAKPGKKVQVYYKGRFKTNNKIFDKTNTGEGLKFTLGLCGNL